MVFGIKVKIKSGGKEVKSRFGKFLDEKRAERKELRGLAMAERKVQAKETVLLREKEAGRRARQRIKSGGFFGMAAKGIGKISSSAPGSTSKSRKRRDISELLGDSGPPPEQFDLSKVKGPLG